MKHQSLFPCKTCICFSFCWYLSMLDDKHHERCMTSLTSHVDQMGWLTPRKWFTGWVCWVFSQLKLMQDLLKKKKDCVLHHQLDVYTGIGIKCVYIIIMFIYIYIYKFYTHMSLGRVSSSSVAFITHRLLPWLYMSDPTYQGWSRNRFADSWMDQFSKNSDGEYTIHLVKL